MSTLALPVKRNLLHLHVRHRKEEEEKKLKKKYPSRRWIVERTNLWHNRYRKLFTRYERRKRKTTLVLYK
jgi:transposase